MHSGQRKDCLSPSPKIRFTYEVKNRNKKIIRVYLVAILKPRETYIKEVKHPLLWKMAAVGYLVLNPCAQPQTTWEILWLYSGARTPCVAASCPECLRAWPPTSSILFLGTTTAPEEEATNAQWGPDKGGGRQASLGLQAATPSHRDSLWAAHHPCRAPNPDSPGWPAISLLLTFLNANHKWQNSISYQNIF